jgi:RNA polymerase sigma-70 factor (ECF subfamily)
LEHCAAGKGPVTNLKSYLFQIAYHLMMDRFRHDHRVISLEGMPESLIPVTSSAQVQLEERERIDALFTALHSELSGPQRHVILLRFLEGFSLKETALIVGKNISSIKVIQHRGIARLRKCLQLDHENNEPDQELRDLLE